jgi:hypothetical protein
MSSPRGQRLPRSRFHLSKAALKIPKKLAQQSGNKTCRTINKYDGNTRVARAFPSFLKPPSQTQKDGSMPGSACLFLIARRGPVIRAVAPIARTSNQPFEKRVFGDSLEHPAEVIAIVRRETEFGSVPHDCRQSIEGVAADEAAVLVASLWPRVRKQDEDAIDRQRPQRPDYQPRIIGKNPDVVEVATFDMREQPGDTWLKYLAADEADLRMVFGLKGNMLARTKTNLKPNRALRSAESRTGFQTARLWDGQSEPRQQVADPDLLPRAKPAPAAAPEDHLTLRQLHNQEG